MLMIKVFINQNEFFFASNTSILEACEYAGHKVPRFCYHQTLSVAGNCRMCLVELAGSPKPVASCAMLVLNNMKIHVNTPLVKKARENVMEALLLNHPLDCPICDQGGECDLQSQSKLFGADSTRFYSVKRIVEDKDCGPVIKTIMTRCIHCTRCVRFNTEISGDEYFGTLNRGSSTEIGSYVASKFSSNLSGNVIDLCPVGALTSKSYSFKARPWELKIQESFLLTDGLGSPAYISSKESEIVRVFPRIVSQNTERFISDKARYYFDSNTNNRQTDFLLNGIKLNSSVAFSNLKKTVLDFKTLVVTNNFSDLNSLLSVKQLENAFLSREENFLGVRKLGHSLKFKNFLSSWLSSPAACLDECDICFIVSSDLRVENSTLNLKIRNRLYLSNIKVFGFGQNQTSTQVPLLNLSLNSLYKIFEAKAYKVSALIVSASKPLFILGENLFKRGLRLDKIFAMIKSIASGSRIVSVQNFYNFEGSSYLNVHRITSRHISKVENLILLNVEDSFSMRKIINNFLGYICIFTTHNSEIADGLKNLNIQTIPCPTEFESSKIFS